MYIVNIASENWNAIAIKIITGYYIIRSLFLFFMRLASSYQVKYMY